MLGRWQKRSGWAAAVAALLAAVLAAAPATVLGTSSKGDHATPHKARTPTAEHLWKTYPLRTRAHESQATKSPTATPSASGSSGPQVQPSGTEVRSPTHTAGSASGGSGWSAGLIAAIIVVAIATALVWGLVLLRRRPGRRAEPGGRDTLRGLGRRRRDVLPPDPTVAWTAGIDWVQEGSNAHFRVLARAFDGSLPTPLLRSPVLPWPPADSGAVDAMTAAVERLEGRLLDAGWRPTEPGRAWYEKRFAWMARPAATPPAAPARGGARDGDADERDGGTAEPDRRRRFRRAPSGDAPEAGAKAAAGPRERAGSQPAGPQTPKQRPSRERSSQRAPSQPSARREEATAGPKADAGGKAPAGTPAGAGTRPDDAAEAPTAGRRRRFSAKRPMSGEEASPGSADAGRSSARRTSPAEHATSEVVGSSAERPASAKRPGSRDGGAQSARAASAPRGATASGSAPANGRSTPGATVSGADRSSAPTRPRQAGAKRAAAAPPQPAATAPAAAAPETARAGRRRNLPWPAEAKALWRAEIRFEAGYAASRFVVAAHPPVGSGAKPKPIVRSEPMKWMFGNPPHPSVQAHREAATRISQAMRAAGWEVIGRGSAWYAERYVWRGAEEPAERIALPDGPAAPDEPRGGGTT